jgi:putative redox protein
MSTRMTLTIDPQRARIQATSPGGHGLSIDADPPHGEGSAPSPKETLLAALAACTAVDVASILRKKQQRVDGYEIVVTGASADEHPKVFTQITVEHRVTGHVDAEAVRRSVELSATRYCPINAMLSASVTITHRYRLEGADGQAAKAVVVVMGPDAPSAGPASAGG